MSLSPGARIAELAAINHPHIATIHSLEDVDGMPALVLVPASRARV